MKKRSILALLATVVFALACFLRVAMLESRPMHGDEANQAVRAGMLMEGGGYRFDPTDHHGPTLYYAALPFCFASADRFSDTSEACYRAVPVAFALALLLGMALLPVKRARFAAFALLAFSPAFCYYNRFFIQETLLVFFLYGMFLCACAWVESSRGTGRWDKGRSLCHAAGFGAFAGLSLCTKETAVLSFAAAAIAALAALYTGGGERPAELWKRIFRALPIAVLVAGGVFVILYSSFFTNMQGLYDALFNTAGAYADKAVASGDHTHPWYRYFGWIGWFQYGRGPIFGEALLVPFALLSGIYSFVKKRRIGIFITLYTLVLTAIYCAIPYKTPWCALSFLFGAIIMAADGFSIVIECGARPVRIAAVVLFAALGIWHALQARRACLVYPADVRNPYVYAHTGNDCLLLVENVRKRLAEFSEGKEALIAIVAPPATYWPLPWYFRDCKNVGCWRRVAEIPAELKVKVLICSTEEGEAAAARMGDGAEDGFYGVRPGVLVQLFSVKKEN